MSELVKEIETVEDMIVTVDTEKDLFIRQDMEYIKLTLQRAREAITRTRKKLDACAEFYEKLGVTGDAARIRAIRDTLDYTPEES